MKRYFKITFTLFVINSFNSPALADSLNWVGCGISKDGFMQELAIAYEKKTGVTIKLRGGGAQKGIRDVSRARADLGGTCRHKVDVPEEANAKLHHVAWDALVVIVSKNNPIKSISLEQIRQIFTGKITNWKNLNGINARIELIVRKGKTSGVGLTAREMLFQNPDLDFHPISENPRSSEVVEFLIGKRVNAIGLTGVSSAKRKTTLKMVPISGVFPAKRNIISGQYPFFRPLYLVTNKKVSGEVQKFVEFALSKEGQTVISRNGTVNLLEGRYLKAMFMNKYYGQYFKELK